MGSLYILNKQNVVKVKTVKLCLSYLVW